MLLLIHSGPAARVPLDVELRRWTGFPWWIVWTNSIRFPFVFDIFIVALTKNPNEKVEGGREGLFWLQFEYAVHHGGKGMTELMAVGTRGWDSLCLSGLGSREQAWSPQTPTPSYDPLPSAFSKWCHPLRNNCSNIRAYGGRSMFRWQLFILTLKNSHKLISITEHTEMFVIIKTISLCFKQTYHISKNALFLEVWARIYPALREARISMSCAAIGGTGKETSPCLCSGWQEWYCSSPMPSAWMWKENRGGDAGTRFSAFSGSFHNLSHVTWESTTLLDEADWPFVQDKKKEVSGHLKGYMRWRQLKMGEA